MKRIATILILILMISCSGTEHPELTDDYIQSTITQYYKQANIKNNTITIESFQIKEKKYSEGAYEVRYHIQFKDSIKMNKETKTIIFRNESGKWKVN